MGTKREQFYPNEIWMMSFQWMDRQTLKSIRLVCHLFASLAWDVILRDITWSNAAISIAGAKSWDQNPALPRDLSLSLENLNAAFMEHPGPEFTQDSAACIFERVRSFSNLRALNLRIFSAAISENLSELLRELPKLQGLTVVGGKIPANLQEVLQGLPSLKQLTLDRCALAPALSQLPVSPLSEYTSNITNLKVVLGGYPFMSTQLWNTNTVSCAGLFSLLPRLRTLHIERSFLPTEHLPTEITSLTIGIPRVRDSPVDDHGKAYLRRVLCLMPHLRSLIACTEQLEVLHLPTLQHIGLNLHHPHHSLNQHQHGHPQSPEMDDPPNLPHLTHFTGAISLALVALAKAPAVEDLCVEAETEREALEFVPLLAERNPLVRRFSVHLPNWNRESARGISRGLAQCERLEITYGSHGADGLGRLDLSPSHVLEDVDIKLREWHAIDVIEFLHERSAPVRRVSVEVASGSVPAVVKAVVRCLPLCERLAITYKNDRPSTAALVDLGTGFIPSLTHLQEVSILPVSRDTKPATCHDQPTGWILVPVVTVPRTIQPEVVSPSHEELVHLEETKDTMNLRGIIFCWTSHNRNSALRKVCLPGMCAATKWVRERDNDDNRWITKVL
ncbi:hypothetical protein FB451DRAFT_196981 [Mycena latifolia]|nr:hypothetical protein FB451DRAFT_196981 [Mycena latifolia]